MKKVFNDLASYDVHQNRNEKKLDIYVPLQTKTARTVTKMKENSLPHKIYVLQL